MMGSACSVSWFIFWRRASRRAPILEQFKGVICAGGTVRSHLGILTREYGIPCLMGAKISGIFEGDTVELEVSGQSKTTEAYQKGVEMTVRVWKHAAKK